MVATGIVIRSLHSNEEKKARLSNMVIVVVRNEGIKGMKGMKE